MLSGLEQRSIAVQTLLLNLSSEPLLQFAGTSTYLSVEKRAAGGHTKEEPSKAIELEEPRKYTKTKPSHEGLNKHSIYLVPVHQTFHTR